MDSASSSPKQINIEFKPLISDSEPSGTLTSSILPIEILLEIGNFADIRTVLNLIATCNYIRNQSNTWFLQLLASENNPDRATSGFIVDAIGDKGDTCLWRNTKFLIKDHDIPKDLSIHLFVNTTAKKIWSDEVRSMIVQVSGLFNSSAPSDLQRDIREFLKFLFLEVSFKNLKCLMFCGIELSSKEFSPEIGALNLDVFHMRNFRYRDFRYLTDLARDKFFCYCYSLKTLYVVFPDVTGDVYPPDELKKLVIYCPKPSKSMIEATKLWIKVKECHALKEM